jgi:hypothetical protein
MDREPQLEIYPEKEKIAKQITRLHWFKDTWKSEIPDQILSAKSQDKMYKVRKNWWAGLVSDFEYGVLPILDATTHAELILKISNFSHDFCGQEFQGKTGRLTTREDIDRADQLIEEILGVLENLQNSI